jgi:predicted metal-dependent hydrolase
MASQPEPAVPTALRAAVGLFNQGKYLAAHEVLDELWEGTQGPDSDFYKGLIQASIALHHLAEGNAAGAARLYGSHRRLLAAYQPRHLGLDVAAFLAAMQRALAPALSARPGEDAQLSPELRPFVALEP